MQPEKVQVSLHIQAVAGLVLVQLPAFGCLHVRFLHRAQLSVTDKSMSTEYWLTAYVKPAQEKCG